MKRCILLCLSISVLLQVQAQDFVDLGLSVDWCTVNIGASAPNQSGYMFAWGETTPRTAFSFDNYKYKNDSCNLFIDQNISGTKYDPATMLNEGWRLPTQYEFLELREKCIWEWIDSSQTKGYRIIGPNGNYIFLPTGGQNSNGIIDITWGEYWCGSFGSIYRRAPISLSFNKTDSYTNETFKEYGKLIRPVTRNGNYYKIVGLPKEWEDPKYENLFRLVETENYEDAFIEVTMLATNNDAKAQCILASMYICEIGTLRNYESAKDLLIESAKKGYRRSEYLLGALAFYEQLQDSVTKKNVINEIRHTNDNNLWYRIFSTGTTPKTYREAIKWFFLVDGKWGNPNIMYNTGITLISGLYGFNDYNSGINWLMESMKLGNNDAFYLLRQLDVPIEVEYDWTNTIYSNLLYYIESQDYENAFKVASKLSSMGDAQAQCVLATMYMCEAGTTRNYNKAQELLIQSAENGYEKGEYLLGGLDCFEEIGGIAISDITVTHDSIRIKTDDNIFWYNMLSCETKADIFRNQILTQKKTSYTYKEAFKWFLLSKGEWEYTDVMYNTGITLVTGKYGYQNESRGVEWIQRAAQLGYINAIEYLMLHNTDDHLFDDNELIDEYIDYVE